MTMNNGSDGEGGPNTVSKLLKLEVVDKVEIIPSHAETPMPSLAAKNLCSRQPRTSPGGAGSQEPPPEGPMTMNNGGDGEGGPNTVSKLLKLEVVDKVEIIPSHAETPMPSLAANSALVRDIWEESAPTAFAEIAALLNRGGRFLISLDTEFAVPDGAVLPGREPPTADGHYAKE